MSGVVLLYSSLRLYGVCAELNERKSYYVVVIRPDFCGYLFSS